MIFSITGTRSCKNNGTGGALLPPHSRASAIKPAIRHRRRAVMWLTFASLATSFSETNLNDGSSILLSGYRYTEGETFTLCQRRGSFTSVKKPWILVVVQNHCEHW
jgi:hypothetical protein